MTIIVFLVDTSPSMMQKSYLGTSYLDYARQTVEQFLKQRQRDPSYKLDRYMLMTYDQYPMNVKSGWKESQAVFVEQLKNLKASGVANFTTAVESVLRFVNLNRLQTGIDNYGCGRFACYPEQVIIISVTDGLGFLSPTGVPSELKLSNSTTIGSELTVEPYRWDHRLFSIVLRFPGHYQNNGLVGGQAFIAEDYPIQTLCAAMGGKSFSLTSHKLLSFCIDSILQKIQYIGVLVRLEKHGPDPLPVSINQPISGVEVPAINGVSCQPARSDVQSSSPFPISDAWKSQMVLIIKPSKYASGNWPIPEAYWPEPTMLTLPPRQVHPTILFRCEPYEPMLVQDFPFDKYDLENSPLSQFILERKQPNVCWQLFMENSSNTPGIGFPFGYIKTSSNLQNLNLFLMPYNYPVLLPLLSEAKDPELVRSPAFRKKFDKYLSTVPRYYFSSLKKSLKRFNISTPFLEDPQVYNYNIRGLIEKIKHHGREKFEKACSVVAKNIEAFPPALVNGPQFIRASSCRLTNPAKQEAESNLHPSLLPFKNTIPQLYKDLNICIAESHVNPVVPSAQFKNPFDIERKSLLSQLEKMRVNFDQQVEINGLHVLEGGMPGQKIKLQHAEDLHSQPISKMGEYAEYMRRLAAIGAAPQRELEPQAARPHAFGNPFKLDKKSMLVDEVGEMSAENAANSSMSGNKEAQQERRPNGIENRIGRPRRMKRKPGPLDPNALNSWKRARRSRSCSETGSETSSVSSELSDLSSVAEADNMGIEKEEFSDDEEDILVIEEQSPCFSSNSHLSSYVQNGLPISSEQKTSSSEPSTSETKLNGFSHSYQPTPSSSNHSMPQKHSTGLNNHKPAYLSLTPAQLSERQMSLSRIVRGIGNRFTVFDKCLEVVQETSRQEKRILLNYALREARRFKRQELVRRLERQLKSMAH